MALASRCLRGFQTINRSVFYVSQQKKLILNGPNSSTIILRQYAGTVGASRAGKDMVKKKRRDPAPFFFSDEVQSCLLEMNMRDISKVFQPRRERNQLVDSELKFLTQEELEEEQRKAAETAKYYLQVPPVLLPGKEATDILSKDPALQGLEESKLLFTDISYSVPHRERLIVVREPDGTLRHATREERSRMIQAYFPDPSRTYEVPDLFSSSNLQSLLERSEFEFILDRACAQFEPDDADYVTIASSTYDFIDENGKYDHLLGTRHYGSMAFYLSFHGKLDKFLKHCISTYKIQDAVALVRVFYLTRPEIPSLKNLTPDDTAFLKEYISNHAQDKAVLSMALNAYLELNLPSEAEEAAIGK